MFWARDVKIPMDHVTDWRRPTSELSGSIGGSLATTAVCLFQFGYHEYATNSFVLSVILILLSFITMRPVSRKQRLFFWSQLLSVGGLLLYLLYLFAAGPRLDLSLRQAGILGFVVAAWCSSIGLLLDHIWPIAIRGDEA